MDAAFAHFPSHSLGLQLGTRLDLGTDAVKKPAIYEVLVGAVGIEFKTNGDGGLDILRNIKAAKPYTSEDLPDNISHKGASPKDEEKG